MIEQISLIERAVESAHKSLTVFDVVKSLTVVPAETKRCYLRATSALTALTQDLVKLNYKSITGEDLPTAEDEANKEVV